MLSKELCLSAIEVNYGHQIVRFRISHVDQWVWVPELCQKSLEKVHDVDSIAVPLFVSRGTVTLSNLITS